MRITHDVSLFQIVDGRSFSVRIDIDVERTGTEGHSSKICHFGGLGGGEEHGLTILYDADDLESVLYN